MPTLSILARSLALYFFVSVCGLIAAEGVGWESELGLILLLPWNCIKTKYYVFTIIREALKRAALKRLSKQQITSCQDKQQTAPIEMVAVAKESLLLTAIVFSLLFKLMVHVYVATQMNEWDCWIQLLRRQDMLVVYMRHGQHLKVKREMRRRKRDVSWNRVESRW